MIGKAVEILRREDCSLVIMDEEEGYITYHESGILPLLQALESNPDIFRGKYVADKVIGKAAALLLLSGGIKECYGILMSDRGRVMFEQHGVHYDYDRKVPAIQNHDRSGMCPMEKLVFACQTPEEGRKLLIDYFETQK